jgi:hypothetical protein
MAAQTSLTGLTARVLFPPTLAGMISAPNNGERRLERYYLQKSPFKSCYCGATSHIAKYKNKGGRSQLRVSLHQLLLRPYRSPWMTTIIRNFQHSLPQTLVPGVQLYVGGEQMR